MVKDKNGILIADDQPLCREGLGRIFVRDLGFSEIYEASDFPTVLARIASHGSIGLATINLGLPGLRGGEGLRDLRVKFPALRVVVIATTRDRDLVLDALGAGVHGYIPKDIPVREMLDALRTVLAGQIYVPTLVSDLTARKQSVGVEETLTHDAGLTDRQFQVLSLLAAGRSNKEIARLLCIAEGTVKVHIAAAFRMLGVHNRVSAAAAMRARTFKGFFAETYLPGLFDQQRQPVSHGDYNGSVQVMPVR
jgi:DNA-binding NarL/FixJ family response regulator